MKSNRDHGSHHFEQDLYPSGVIQPLESAHEIDERAGEDANVLAFTPTIAIQLIAVILAFIPQRPASGP